MTANILSIEDNQADLVLLQKSLDWYWPTANFKGVKDGAKGLDHIVKEAIDLVLLDLEMPEMNGFEVLERIREEKDKKPLVVVLSGSQSEADIKRCYELSASAYMVKPASLEQYGDFVHNLQVFWNNGGPLKGSSMNIWFA